MFWRKIDTILHVKIFSICVVRSSISEKKQRSCVMHIVNIMTADGLVTWGIHLVHRAYYLAHMGRVKAFSAVIWYGLTLCVEWMILINKWRLNSSWPNNATWFHISRSTLAQVMACYLVAPSHYLKQCWLILKGVLRYSPEGNFTRNAHKLNLNMS